MKALRADSPLADAPFEIFASVSDAFDVDGFRRLADLGVDAAVTMPWMFYGMPRSFEDKRDGLNRFADEVISKL